MRVATISVIGMGYVGFPLAAAFAEKGIEVIGFDINENKIKKYRQGEDTTNEVGPERLSRLEGIVFTSDERELQRSRFHIVAVPTPVGKNNIPDLKPIEGSSRIVGRNLTRGSYVVFESTVYPGVTEEICVPILEQESGLKCGVDFKVGYSPERINPGDKVNTLETIVKIVSGMDSESLEVIASVYEMIVRPGVHRAPTIKVAEAAKVIENAQRDVNIAFVNELSMIFEKLGIDTYDVLEAAGTKWNFLKFQPGLVGGHCIGVDPYYLTYRSEEAGHLSQLISAGRRINDSMSKHVAEMCVKGLIQTDRRVKGAKVLILGLTFKENCPDLRNSKVADVIKELREYGIEPIVCDPLADPEEAWREYEVRLRPIEQVSNIDAVILAVKHQEYLNLNVSTFASLYNPLIEAPLFIDLKACVNKTVFKASYTFKRL